MSVHHVQGNHLRRDGSRGPELRHTPHTETHRAKRRARRAGAHAHCENQRVA